MPRAQPVAFRVEFVSPDGHVLTPDELREWGKSERVARAWVRLLAAAQGQAQESQAS